MIRKEDDFNIFSVEKLIHNKDENFYEVLSIEGEIYLSYLFSSVPKKSGAEYSIDKVSELGISSTIKPSDKLIDLLLIKTAK